MKLIRYAVEYKDSAMLKRKLCHVNSANINEGVMLCEFNEVHYKEMETSDLVSVMIAYLLNVGCTLLLNY